MPINRKLLENALDEIARGDATPAEATATVRAALEFDPPLVDRVYDALRDVTWRTLTSRSFGEELQDWFEVFRHTSALIGEESIIASKVRALADLLGQSSRFDEFQPLDEVLSRKHSKSVLSALASAGDVLKKSALKNILGLADANLSRVTGALQARGLIDRSSSGKEASFSLTELGDRTARKLGLAVRDKAAGQSSWWLDAPFPIAVWDADGKPVGANATFFETASQVDKVLPAYSEWRLEISKAARDEQWISRNTWQLRLSDDQWVQFVEQAANDGSRCILVADVSLHMKAYDILKNELQSAAAAATALQEELAASERKLFAFRRSTGQIKEGILGVASQSSKQIREWMTDPSSVAAEQLHDFDRRLGAIQLAIRNVMEPLDIVEREGTELDWFDPAQIVAEAVDTASVLGGSLITCRFDNVAKVKGAVSPLRTALGHMFFMGTKHHAHSARAVMKGSKFVATYCARKITNLYTDDTVADLGLSYAKTVAESHGGGLAAKLSRVGEETEALVELTFPFRGATAGDRG